MAATDDTFSAPALGEDGRTNEPLNFLLEKLHDLNTGELRNTISLTEEEYIGKTPHSIIYEKEIMSNK